MIKLPKFNMQSMYDAETDFNSQMSPERMSKFLIHYEAFKLIKKKIKHFEIFKRPAYLVK